MYEAVLLHKTTIEYKCPIDDADLRYHEKYVVSSDVMKWFRIIYRCVCIVQSSCMSNIMTFCLISVADCTNVLLLCLVVLYYTTLRYSAYVGYVR